MAKDGAAALLPRTRTLTVDGGVLSYCVYGPEDGLPVISHNGTPSTRWKRPEIVAGIERAGVRMLSYDRPGYQGSTRRVGRRVSDGAEDARLLADAVGWERFAVHGHSGGGPFALACAALLPERVTRCAVGASLAPSHAETVDFFGREDPSRGESLRPALEGEDARTRTGWPPACRAPSAATTRGGTCRARPASPRSWARCAGSARRARARRHPTPSPLPDRCYPTTATRL